MTPEQLMIPRYIVENLYPGCPFQVGDILMQNTNTIGEVWVHVNEVGEPNFVTSKEIADFPYLFRKLEWWEERKIEDMPVYLKEEGETIKVAEWAYEENIPIYFRDEKENYFTWVKGFMPATEAEYNTYIESLKQK